MKFQYLLIFGFAVVLIISCGTEATITSISASDVYMAFRNAGLEVENPHSLTKEDYGMAPLLCTGAYFYLPSICENCGGRIFECINQNDLNSLASYYLDLGNIDINSFSWVIIKSMIIVQIDGKLPEEVAMKYAQAIPGEGQLAGNLSLQSTVAENTMALQPTPSNTLNITIFKPGTYIVGKDIQPGYYQGEAGYSFFDYCYWARLRDLSGQIDSIIANDNEIGQYYIELKPSDYALETGCNISPFSYSTNHEGSYPQKINPGTYLVNTDIQPGTYQGQAGQEITTACYWARLSSVSGELSSIIANDNAMGQFYVQVNQSDFALATSCELTLIE